MDSIVAQQNISGSLRSVRRQKYSVLKKDFFVVNPNMFSRKWDRRLRIPPLYLALGEKFDLRYVTALKFFAGNVQCRFCKQQFDLMYLLEHCNEKHPVEFEKAQDSKPATQPESCAATEMPGTKPEKSAMADWSMKKATEKQDTATVDTRYDLKVRGRFSSPSQMIINLNTAEAFPGMKPTYERARKGLNDKFKRSPDIDDQWTAENSSMPEMMSHIQEFGCELVSWTQIDAEQEDIEAKFRLTFSE